MEKQTQKTMIHVDDYLEKCQALIPKGDDFINRPSTNRTFGVGEREEFRLFERDIVGNHRENVRFCRSWKGTISKFDL